MHPEGDAPQKLGFQQTKVVLVHPAQFRKICVRQFQIVVEFRRNHQRHEEQFMHIPRIQALLGVVLQIPVNINQRQQEGLGRAVRVGGLSAEVSLDGNPGHFFRVEETLDRGIVLVAGDHFEEHLGETGGYLVQRGRRHVEGAVGLGVGQGAG